MITQSEKLEQAAGNHQDDEGMAPLDTVETSGPRFPYSAVRDRIREYAPPVPRSYGGRNADEEGSEEDEEDEESDTLEAELKAYVVSKQGHEVSPWVLPSARSRREVFATLSSMGCSMAD
jgi:hypothetical protein